MDTITFLGTGGSVVSKKRMCAGVLFRDKLIDVGFGVLSNLIRTGTKLDSINDIYVSHTHSDHIGDFTALVWAMAMQNRTKRVRIVSSAGTANSLEKILELQSTPRSWVKFEIDFVRPEDLGVKHFTTLHEPQNLAYRFETERGGFVYAGDTSRYEKLAEFAKDCDLMIHDATFLDGQESIAAVTKHSTARDAGSIAKLADARRLVLTHISPANEGSGQKYIAQASSDFKGQVVTVRDRQKIQV